MTKQEAIEILRDTPIDIRSTREDDIHTLYATAQGMAIEALSCSEKPNRSEPKTAENGSVEKEMPEIKTDRTTSGDLINRQDAINAFEPDHSQDWYTPYIIEKLESLPSAQPYTDEEIQAMQDLEQAQLDKAYELGWKEGQEALREEIWEYDRDRLD